MEADQEVSIDTIHHEPLVSVLMLTYNRADFLKAAIESVIAQSYTNWELIVIDDGSTDQTADIVASFRESRVRYIRHHENSGLFARRAESLRYVKGSYIAVLDSDDYWSSTEKLAEQVAFMEAQLQCAVVGTFCTLINAHGHEIGKNQFATGDTSIRDRILMRNQFVHSSVLMRTDLVLKTRGYQPTLAEDLELFLQLGQLGTFANIPSYMTAHRIHSHSENDRGVRMLSGVRNIIKTHGSRYPHATQANVWVLVRLGVAHLSNSILALKQKVHKSESPRR
jgi:glycosyltransferase involved in cell wall biosynthesis